VVALDLAVAVLGGGFLWVCLGVAWEFYVLVGFGFFPVFLSSFLPFGILLLHPSALLIMKYYLSKKKILFYHLVHILNPFNLSCCEHRGLVLSFVGLFLLS
jgi:hypothetical protein